MATMCDLDLQPNTETSVKIIYWDYKSGADVVLIIHDDNTCERQTGYDDDGDPITEDVNLFEALQAIQDQNMS